MSDVLIRHGGRQRHDYKIRQKFGIGLRQYEALFQQQEGRCYLCQTPDPTGRNLAVDHCHKTGKVRRLLCHHCNTALGHFNDDPNLMIRAAQYITEDFDTPKDVEEPYPERKSYRAVVSTPDGTFPGFRAAGQYYGVDETTVATWCGRRKGHLKRDGFDFTMMSIKPSEIGDINVRNQ